MAKIKPDAIYKLMISREQVHAIVGALELRPYAEVFQLIEDIKEQVIPQMNQGESNEAK